MDRYPPLRSTVLRRKSRKFRRQSPKGGHSVFRGLFAGLSSCALLFGLQLAAPNEADSDNAYPTNDQVAGLVNGLLSSGSASGRLLSPAASARDGDLEAAVAPSRSSEPLFAMNGPSAASLKAEVLPSPAAPKSRTIIRSWFGGKPMELDSLRYTVEFVTSVLKPDGMWARRDVHDLLLETAAVETALGRIVRQKKGPALSVWQILGFNFVEIRKHFAKADPDLLERAMLFYDRSHTEDWNRIYNIPWTAAMSLLFYEKATDGAFMGQLESVESRGRLWKEIYNTHRGKGTVEKYKQRAYEFVHAERG